MAHQIETGPQRSQLLARLLAEGRQRNKLPSQIFSRGEGFSRLGSQLIDAFSDKSQLDKAREQEEKVAQTRQKALSDLLSGGKGQDALAAGLSLQDLASATALLDADAKRSLPTGFEPLTPEQAIAAGLQPGTAAQRNLATGQTSVLQQPPKPVVPRPQKTTFQDLTPEAIKRSRLPEGTVAQRGSDGRLNIISTPKPATAEKAITDVGKFNQALARDEITQDQFNSAMTKKLGLSGETAFKAAGIAQARDALPQIFDLLFTNEGTKENPRFDLNESNLIPGVRFFPGTTDTRNLRTLMRSAINAMLRGESGAAIPEAEIETAFDTFFPTAGDSDETALLKFRQLEKRIVGASDLLSGNFKQNDLKNLSDEDLLKRLRGQ